MKDLPTYVSTRLGCVPATRLYEGDMLVLMNLLTKMNGHIVDNGSAMAAIANDLCIPCETLKSVTIRYDTIRYIYVRSKADEMASLALV